LAVHLKLKSTFRSRLGINAAREEGKGKGSAEGEVNLIKKLSKKRAFF
jgi:hypothetical protein